ncbi:hypothetical protein PVL29_020953 [Vitis rotundifolia]|uniref:Uncharacterized protein n=1 Tax=Vitis rotundifolia TaxID=103349 RepID=A0AA38YY90_VITRO|nr:hypothetical protein PVL29_020953 [Vitis rotundifolia]
MHSSTFSVNWYTEEMALYGSTTMLETDYYPKNGKTDEVSITLSTFGVNIHPPIIPWEIILMGCIIPRPCERDPNGTGVKEDY